MQKDILEREVRDLTEQELDAITGGCQGSSCGGKCGKPQESALIADIADAAGSYTKLV